MCPPIGAHEIKNSSESSSEFSLSKKKIIVAVSGGP